MKLCVVLLLLGLAWCYRPKAEEQKPRCPDSDRAACTSGGLQCTYDEKRACDMCLCKHEVM